MATLQSLREQRATRIDAIKAIHAKASTENRDLTDAEQSAFDTGRGEVDRLDRDIRNAEFLAEAERQAEAEPVTERRGDLRSYSLAKAIQESMAGRLTGVEAEQHQELSRGRETRGVMVPASILLEHRAVTTTTPVAGPGGTIISRTVLPVQDQPRPALLVESMGATVLRDLVGNIDLPTYQAGAVGWVAEHTNVTRTDPQLHKTSMSPKTVGGEYEISRRMILQTSASIEALLRNDLGLLLRTAVDKAAISGTGGVQPTGIINTAGVQYVPSAALSDVASDLIAALEVDDIHGTRGFLAHPALAAKARKIKDGQGHVIGLDELFHGEKLAITTQAPTGYVHAAGDTAGNALIYGQWDQLVIGYWSGVDLLVNPYHVDVASKGGVLIHAFLDCDVAVRNPLAFAFTSYTGNT